MFRAHQGTGVNVIDNFEGHQQETCRIGDWTSKEIIYVFNRKMSLSLSLFFYRKLQFCTFFISTAGALVVVTV